MRSALFPLFLAYWLAACGASGTIASSPSRSHSELSPADRSDDSGSHFVCEGQGPDKEQALATAHGVCTDKVCRVCGVEVESVVQSTETLQGVSMQRKVVEQSRRRMRGIA